MLLKNSLQIKILLDSELSNSINQINKIHLI
jgi:hypothetical protein